MSKMRGIIFKSMVISLGLSIWFSFQSVYAQVNPVRTYKMYEEGEVGQEFGSCVKYVKQNRPDLQGISYGYAKEMVPIAKDKGFEVNTVPSEGAVLVLPNIEYEDPKTHKIEVTGHVAVVQEVSIRQDGKYKLVIMDANFDKLNKIGKAEVIYNPDKAKIERLNYKAYGGGKDIIIKPEEPQDRQYKYSDVKFIHENTEVINTFKQVIGREPNVEELIEYSRNKLLGENIREELLESLKYAEERRQHSERKKKLEREIAHRRQILDSPSPPNLVEEPARGIREKVTKTLTLRLMGEKGKQSYNQLYDASLRYNRLAREALDYADRFLNEGDLGNAEKYVEKARNLTQLMIDADEAALQIWERNEELVTEIQHRMAKAGVKVAGLSLEAVAILAGHPELIKDINALSLFANYIVDTKFLGKDEATRNLLVDGMVSVGTKVLAEGVLPELVGYIEAPSGIEELFKNEADRELFKKLVETHLLERLVFKGVSEETAKKLVNRLVSWVDGFAPPPSEAITLEFEPSTLEFEPSTLEFEPSEFWSKLTEVGPKFISTPPVTETHREETVETTTAAAISGTLSDGLFYYYDTPSQSILSQGSMSGSFSGTSGNWTDGWDSVSFTANYTNPTSLWLTKMEGTATGSSGNFEGYIGGIKLDYSPLTQWALGIYIDPNQNAGYLIGDLSHWNFVSGSFSATGDLTPVQMSSNIGIAPENLDSYLTWSPSYSNIVDYSGRSWFRGDFQDPEGGEFFVETASGTEWDLEPPGSGLFWGAWVMKYGGTVSGTTSDDWHSLTFQNLSYNATPWDSEANIYLDINGTKWSDNEITGYAYGYAYDDELCCILYGETLGTYSASSTTTFQALTYGYAIDAEMYWEKLQSDTATLTALNIPVTEVYTCALTGSGSFGAGGSLTGITMNTKFLGATAASERGLWSSTISGSYSGLTGSDWSMYLTSGPDYATITGREWSGGKFVGEVVYGYINSSAKVDGFKGAVAGTYGGGTFSGYGGGYWENY